MTIDDDDKKRAYATQQAIETGCGWLNDVLQFRDESTRLFSRRFKFLNVRLTTVERVWVVMTFLVYTVVMFGISLVIHLSIASLLLFKPIIPIEGLAIGWYLGRWLAHVSPLRRYTGEGMSSWTKLQGGRLMIWVRSWLGTPITYGMMRTEIGNSPSVVPCVEWLGTARAPSMPPATSLGTLDLDDDDRDSFSDEEPFGRYVIFPPRGVPVAWAHEQIKCPESYTQGTPE
jgi:hypothetical protein